MVLVFAGDFMKDGANHKRKQSASSSSVADNNKKAKNYSGFHAAIIAGDGEKVEQILNNAAASGDEASLQNILQERDVDNNTAMHLAIKNGRMKILCQLMARAENFVELFGLKNNSNLTAFGIAGRHKDKNIKNNFPRIILLFENGNLGLTKLHKLVSDWQFSIPQALPSGATEDSNAARDSNEELNHFLRNVSELGVIKAFLPIKARSLGGKTALHLLVEKFTDIYLADLVGQLYHCAESVGIAKEFLLAQDDEGNNFLHHLIHSAKNSNVLQDFITWHKTTNTLAYDELFNAKNKAGDTPFDILMRRQYLFSSEVLFSIAHALKKTALMLQYIVLCGDLQKIESFIKITDSFNVTQNALTTPDKDGYTVLHHAVLKKDVNKLKFLLTKVIECNAFSVLLVKTIGDESTVLHLAASCGYIDYEVIKTAHKGKVLAELLPAQDKSGDTVLHKLAMQGKDIMNVGSVLYYADQYGIFDKLWMQKNNNGDVAFLLAKSSLVIAKFIDAQQQRKSSSNLTPADMFLVRDNAGNNILHKAFSAYPSTMNEIITIEGAFDKLNLLTKCVYSRNNDGFSVVDIAQRRMDHFSDSPYAILLGNDIRKYKLIQGTQFHSYILYGEMDEIKTVTSEARRSSFIRSLFYAQDDNGCNSLHHAAKAGNIEFLSYIETGVAGIGIEIMRELMLGRSCMGNMPLHVAVLEEKVEVMKILLAMAKICGIEKEVLLAQNNAHKNIPMLAATHESMQNALGETIGKWGMMLLSEGISVQQPSR